MPSLSKAPSTIVLCTFIVAALIGCSKPSVSGDAFVIKGGGSVVPASGQPIYFLPYESELALIHEVAAEAHQKTLAQYIPVLLSSCPDAIQLTKSLVTDNENKVSDLKIAKTVPKEGCANLEQAVVMLEGKVISLKSAHEEKITALTAEVTAAENAKANAVKAKAAELETEELSKVEIKIAQDGQNVYFKVSNRSEYCLGSPGRFRVTYHAGQVKLWEIDEFTEPQDTYGFKIPCGVPPDAVYDFRSILHGYPPFTTMLDQAELSLAEAQGKLETVEGNHGNRTPKITAIEIGESQFVKLDQKTLAGKVQYSVRTVNWLRLAEESIDIVNEYDPLIRSAVSALEEEMKRYAAVPAVGEFEAKTNELAACQRDSEILSDLNFKLGKLHNVQSGLKGCEDDPVGAATVERALVTLNQDYEAGFELPETEDQFQKNVFASFAEVGSAEGVYKAETSIKGAYSIPEIPKGDYLVLSEYTDNFSNGFWLFPATIEGDQKLDLNMSQFFNHSFSEYLQIQALKMCKECQLEDASLMSRSEAEGYFKN